jgi:hypothetical protein
MYLIAQKLLKKDKSGCYQFYLTRYPNKLITTIEKELKEEAKVLSDRMAMVKEELLQSDMFQIENVPLSTLKTDNKAVTELSKVMMSLPKDKVSSVLIGLHVCSTKKAASNLFIACKRNLNDKSFVSKTIFNEAKVYQGTRIWRKY